MLEKFLGWLLVSSQDPEKFSLTFKGMMLQYVGAVILVLQLFDVPMTETDLVNYAGLVAGIGGTAMGLVGMARKLYYEVKYLTNR